MAALDPLDTLRVLCGLFSRFSSNFSLNSSEELGSLRKRRVVRVRLRPTGVGLHLGCGGAMKTANATIGAGKC